MIFGVEDNKRLICGMCNRVVTNLVPLYDKDHAHKNTMCCVKCKRHIKSGNMEPIEKFKRDAAVYKAIEDNFDRVAGKRKVVERV